VAIGTPKIGPIAVYAATGTTSTVAYPDNVVIGDFLLIAIPARANTAFSALGWSVIDAQASGGDFTRFTFMWRIATSIDVNASSVTVTGPAVLRSFKMMAVSGVDQTNPLDGTPTNFIGDSTAANTAISIPSQTPTTTGCMPVWGVTGFLGAYVKWEPQKNGVVNGTNVVEWLDTWQEVTVSSTAGRSGAAYWETPLNNSAATGTRGGLPQAAATSVGIYLLLRPAPVAQNLSVSHADTATSTDTVIAGIISPTNLWRGPHQVDNLVGAYPELAPIANTPQAMWITEGTTQFDVSSWATAAAGKTLVLSVYAIPGRDNGQYSAGGFANRAAYLNFITSVVKNGVGNAPAIIVYEADALGLARNLDATTKAERLETMRQAIDILADIPNAEVYVDASGWVPAAEQASLLQQIDIIKIAGFANNTSGYESEATVIAYGNSVIAQLGSLGITGKKFVMDTSRNGVGPLTSDFPGAQPWFDAGQTWCNPPGRRLGRAPGPVSDQTNVRAALWIKAPGESDGNSPQMSTGVPNTFVSTYYGASAPNAGVYWVPLARDLLGLTPQPVGGSATGTVLDVIADFEAAGSGWGSFTIRSANTTLVSGRARIPVGVNSYENIETAKAYTLRGGSVYARVYPHAAAGAASTSIDFTINANVQGTRILARIDPALGELMLAAESGYYDPAQVKVPYDPIAHAWLRLRESNGTTYWDTSPDGATWTTRKTAPTPSWVDGSPNSSVQFVANRDAGTPNYAEVDNVNAAVAPVDYAKTSVDAATLTDTVIVSAGRRATAADVVTATDAASTGAIYTPSRTDAATATDAASTTTTGQRVAAETVTATDSVSTTRTTTRLSADTASITDAASAAHDWAPPTPADTAQLTDSVDALVSLGMFPIDIATLSDDASVTKNKFVTISDAVTATETLALTQDEYGEGTKSDAVTVTDVAIGVYDRARLPADIASLIDTITIVRTTARVVADAITATDIGSGGAVVTRDFTDTVTVTDAAAPVQDIARAPADQARATDAVTFVMGQSVPVSDTAAITDAVAIGTNRLSTDAGIITDAVTLNRTNVRTVTDAARITDAVTVQRTSSRVAADTIRGTDALAVAGTQTIVRDTTADVDAELRVGMRQIRRLRAVVPVNISAIGNLEHGAQRATFSIGMTGNLIHVRAVAARADVSIDMLRLRLRAVRSMTDIVLREIDPLVTGLVLRNGPIYSDATGASATGGQLPTATGPTGAPVWRMARNTAVPAGWGSYIAADLPAGVVPAGTHLRVSLYMRTPLNAITTIYCVTDAATDQVFVQSIAPATGDWDHIVFDVTTVADWRAGLQRMRASVSSWIEWSAPTVQVIVPAPMMSARTQPDDVTAEPEGPKPVKFARPFTVLR